MGDQGAPPDVKRLVRKLANDLAAALGVDPEDAYQTGMTAEFEYRSRWQAGGPATYATCAFSQARFAILDMAAKEERLRKEVAGVKRAVAPLLEVIEAPDPTLEPETREAELLDALASVAVAAVSGLLDSPSTPEDLFAEAQQRAILQEAVDKGLAEADPLDRELFLECKLGEVPVTEAAKRRGLKQTDAYWRLQRSFEAVKKQVRASAA